MNDSALLRAYEPVVRFTQGEMFFPSAVDEYLRWCSLWAKDRRAKPRLLAEVGSLDVERLAKFDHIPAGQGMFLRFVEQPLSRPEYQQWKHRPGRVAFSATGRHARVPLFSRVLDAGFNFSLMIRGSVPGGTAAAAEIQCREMEQRDARRVYYGRVVRQGGWIALHYLFFYAMNDWRSGFHGTNDHEADWEQIFVYLYQPDDGGPPVPWWVAYASHEYEGDDLRRRWDDPELQREGNHPVVYVGAGSHASYFEPGEYIMRVEPAFLHSVKVAALRFRQWWAETLGQGSTKAVDRTIELLSVPFVDYARGDGLSVGPGHEEEWTPIVISDLGWAHRYRGLWGLDTGDPFRGERAPAGPMHNRDGSVRVSWDDPVGWAGLDKVPPPPRMVPALDARLEELEARAAELTRQIEEQRLETRRVALDQEGLRGAAFLGGLRKGKAEELQVAVDRLHALRTERISVGETIDTTRVHRARLASGDWGPPATHVRRAHRPEPPATGRGRVVELWSAVSGAIALLGFVALLVLWPGNWWSWALALALVLAGIEALARRRFVQFLLHTVVVLGVITGLVLFREFWRQLVVVGLAGLALFIMRDNLRELRS